MAALKNKLTGLVCRKKSSPLCIVHYLKPWSNSIVKGYNISMKLESVYYTPQQVASFYSIRKDTLLYYDKIGLFSPSKRRDNGYRCYDASKLSELETILTLRDLGFSIPAIKDAIDSLNAASFMSLLEKEEGSIRRKIDSYLSLLSVIDAIRRATADATKAESRKLYTAAFPSQPIMTEPIRNKKGEATDDEVWAEAYGKLLARADGKAIIMTGSIVDLGNAESGHADICRSVYVTYGRESGEEIPKGRYAYMYFPGPLGDVKPWYGEFLTALRGRSLVPVGDIYEELTISSVTTREESEHRTKLLVRVAQSDGR